MKVDAEDIDKIVWGLLEVAQVERQRGTLPELAAKASNELWAARHRKWRAAYAHSHLAKLCEHWAEKFAMGIWPPKPKPKKGDHA